MCGITGKFAFGNNADVTTEQIKLMTDALSHRGPDDEGVFVDRHIGLGHRRLSIIDLSPTGHQPMSDYEKKVWIVFNGEIYNFLGLRAELEKDGIKFASKTDTEVIIYLYKKYGTKCLKHLRGMFAFAIWDKEKSELFLARDRVGKKPLKYYFDKNVFIFASELKAIFKNPEVSKEPDYEAIDEYLTYQYVPHPKTGFKNIFKLEPAHFLLIKKDGTVIKEKYWSLDYSGKLDMTEPEWEKSIEEKLRESINLRLISDVPLGAHLSGGIDSSLIVALMAQESDKKVKTFSIGFEEADYNELQYARLVAKRYKTEHQEFIVKTDAVELLPELAYHYEEPFADSSALPTWYLSKLTREHVTVALNGDGGDENFAGYSRYNAMKLFKQLKIIPFKSHLRKINYLFHQITKMKIFRKGYRFLDAYSSSTSDFYRNIIDYFEQNEKEQIYTDKMKKEVKNSRWRSFLKGKLTSNKDLNWLDCVLSADFNSYLPDDLLVKVDIASMAHALEIRSPFLDHEFLALTAKIPPRFKMKGHNKKYILKRVAYKFLPHECIDRPKQGFGVPLEHWFREKLQSYLKEQLLDKNFIKHGIFTKEGMENLINSHSKGKNNYANQLWALLMLRAWFKIWFE